MAPRGKKTVEKQEESQSAETYANNRFLILPGMYLILFCINYYINNNNNINCF